VLKNVVVTGGAGFVGRHLVARLLNIGIEVTVLDDFSTTSISRLAVFDGHPRLHVSKTDLRDAEATRLAIASIAPDGIVHLAARHFIPACIANPADALAVNVIGTQNLLDACSLIEGVNFVFTSTADVYSPDNEPHAESGALGSNNVYGASKLLGEQLIEFFASRHKVNVSIARLFNVYGPGETNPHLLPDILGCIERQTDISLGNTSTKRDYVYVGDVTAALDHLLHNPIGLTPVNVGTGQSWTALDLVQHLSIACNRTLNVTTDPAKVRPSDRPNLQADVARRDCVFPNMKWTTLTDGLSQTVASELRIPVSI
jgi:UDP-glucose 4-epimerase